MAADGAELREFRKILGKIGGPEMTALKLPADKIPSTLWKMDDTCFEKVHAVILTAEEEAVEKRKGPYSAEVQALYDNAKKAAAVFNDIAVEENEAGELPVESPSSDAINHFETSDISEIQLQLNSVNVNDDLNEESVVTVDKEMCNDDNMNTAYDERLVPSVEGLEEEDHSDKNVVFPSDKDDGERSGETKNGATFTDADAQSFTLERDSPDLVVPPQVSSSNTSKSKSRKAKRNRLLQASRKTQVDALLTSSKTVSHVVPIERNLFEETLRQDDLLSRLAIPFKDLGETAAKVDTYEEFCRSLEVYEPTSEIKRSSSAVETELSLGDIGSLLKCIDSDCDSAMLALKEECGHWDTRDLLNHLMSGLPVMPEYRTKVDAANGMSVAEPIESPAEDAIVEPNCNTENRSKANVLEAVLVKENHIVNKIEILTETKNEQCSAEENPLPVPHPNNEIKHASSILQGIRTAEQNTSKSSVDLVTHLSTGRPTVSKGLPVTTKPLLVNGKRITCTESSTELDRTAFKSESTNHKNAKKKTSNRSQGWKTAPMSSHGIEMAQQNNVATRKEHGKIPWALRYSSIEHNHDEITECQEKQAATRGGQRASRSQPAYANGNSSKEKSTFSSEEHSSESDDHSSEFTSENVAFNQCNRVGRSASSLSQKQLVQMCHSEMKNGDVSHQSKSNYMSRNLKKRNQTSRLQAEAYPTVNRLSSEFHSNSTEVKNGQHSNAAQFCAKNAWSQPYVENSGQYYHTGYDGADYCNNSFKPKNRVPSYFETPGTASQRGRNDSDVLYTQYRANGSSSQHYPTSSGRYPEYQNWNPSYSVGCQNCPRHRHQATDGSKGYYSQNSQEYRMLMTQMKQIGQYVQYTQYMRCMLGN